MQMHDPEVMSEKMKPPLCQGISVTSFANQKLWTQLNKTQINKTHFHAQSAAYAAPNPFGTHVKVQPAEQWINIIHLCKISNQQGKHQNINIKSNLIQ